MNNEDNNINVRLIEKINNLEESYGKTFSNTQKILLSTDGSITAILDVLYGKISLDTLQQHGNEAAMFLLSSEAEQQHNPCKGASAVYGYMG